MVAGKTRSSKLGASPLSQHVGDEGELRPAGLVVGLAIVDVFDCAGYGGQDRSAEADKEFWWFAGDEPAPGPWRRSPVRVDRNQVDRVGGPECIRAMARHAIDGAVLHAGGAPKGERQDDGVARGLTGRTKHGRSLAHLLPGHLVVVADDLIVWRWFDAVVVDASDGLVRLWEPAHGEVVAQPRYSEVTYTPGQRAYLSAGLPGAEWWVEGQALGNSADAVVDVAAALGFLSEHGHRG